MSSPILVGDHIDTVSRIGMATCLVAKTGAEVWRDRLGGEPCAALITIHGKVLFLCEDGTAFVVEPGPTFKLLHKNKLGDGDTFRTSPAIVDGQLLLRSDRRLYCIEVGNREELPTAGWADRSGVAGCRADAPGTAAAQLHLDNRIDFR